MARAFVAASSQYLQVASAVLNATPLSMACWFLAPDTTANHPLVYIEDDDDATSPDYFALGARGDQAGDPIWAMTHPSGTTTMYAASTAGYTSGVWQHALGTFTNASQRDVYLNGGNRGSNNTARTPTAAHLSHTTIGAMHSQGVYSSVTIAEAAIWNVELGEIDARMLYQGYSPLAVRPANLIAYWPLIGNYSPEIDTVGGYGLTLSVSAPTKADHARVLYAVKPSARKATYSAPPPAGGTQFLAHGKYW